MQGHASEAGEGLPARLRRPAPLRARRGSVAAGTRKAAKLAGAKMDVQDAKLDVNKQVQLADSMLSRGYDGIMTIDLFAHTMDAFYKRADRKGADVTRVQQPARQRSGGLADPGREAVQIILEALPAGRDGRHALRHARARDPEPRAGIQAGRRDERGKIKVLALKRNLKETLDGARSIAENLLQSLPGHRVRLGLERPRRDRRGLAAKAAGKKLDHHRHERLAGGVNAVKKGLITATWDANQNAAGELMVIHALQWLSTGTKPPVTTQCRSRGSTSRTRASTSPGRSGRRSSGSVGRARQRDALRPRGRRPAGAGPAASLLGSARAGRRAGPASAPSCSCSDFGLAIAEPDFRTSSNIWNVLRANAIPIVMACGMTFVILARGIDLSVGAMLALVSMFLGEALIARVARHARGRRGDRGRARARARQRAADRQGKINFFVVTLGTSIIFRSGSLLITDGNTITLFGRKNFDVADLARRPQRRLGAGARDRRRDRLPRLAMRCCAGRSSAARSTRSAATRGGTPGGDPGRASPRSPSTRSAGCSSDSRR